MPGKVCAVALLVGCVGVVHTQSKPVCRRAVLEGEVSAGHGFEKVFAPGLMFFLEPIASGWIVRILPVGEPRGAHDYAELATPPYRSVTPLAIGTDFSFRAQDAVAWNPRRFNYAATAGDFRAMSVLYGPAASGDVKAANALAELAARQPEAELRILDSRLVAGTNDQARMAAAVASHLETTPHTVEQGASPLGRVTWMKFRVGLVLMAGVRAAAGVQEEKIFCVNQAPQTTTGAPIASELSSPVRTIKELEQTFNNRIPKRKRILATYEQQPKRDEQQRTAHRRSSA